MRQSPLPFNMPVPGPDAIPKRHTQALVRVVDVRWNGRARVVQITNKDEIQKALEELGYEHLSPQGKHDVHFDGPNYW